MTTRWALVGLGVIACGCGGEAPSPASSPPATRVTGGRVAVYPPASEIDVTTSAACARSSGLTADRARTQLERERRAMSAEERTEIDATTDWDLLLAFAAIDPPPTP